MPPKSKRVPKDVLMEAAKRLGRRPEEIDRYGELLRDNWIDDLDALGKTSQRELQSMGIPLLLSKELAGMGFLCDSLDAPPARERKAGSRGPISLLASFMMPWKSSASTRGLAATESLEGSGKAKANAKTEAKAVAQAKAGAAGGKNESDLEAQRQGANRSSDELSESILSESGSDSSFGNVPNPKVLPKSQRPVSGKVQSPEKRPVSGKVQSPKSGSGSTRNSFKLKLTQKGVVKVVDGFGNIEFFDNQLIDEAWPIRDDDADSQVSTPRSSGSKEFASRPQGNLARLSSKASDEEEERSISSSASSSSDSRGENNSKEVKQGFRIKEGFLDYDPNAEEWTSLNVDPAVRELFQDIAKYKMRTVELDTTLKPFIPEYIPGIGEVDALLAPPMPKGADPLSSPADGMVKLREPALNQSNSEQVYAEMLRTSDQRNFFLQETVFGHTTCLRKVTIFRIRTVLMTLTLMVDVGLDFQVCRTWLADGQVAFASLSVFIMIAPKICYWAFLRAYGLAGCFGLIVNILQIEPIINCVESLRDGKANHSFFWSQVTEGSMEGPWSALLTTYAILLGENHGDARTQAFLVGSVFSSFVNIAKAVAMLDFYGRNDVTWFEWLSTLLARFVEVCFRITSVAIFGYLSRKPHASLKENVQVMLQLLLLNDFLVMLGIVHYAQQKSSWGMKLLFATIMVLCRPPVFLHELRRTQEAYILVRLGELTLMVGLGLVLSPLHSAHTRELLKISPAICGMCAVSGTIIFLMFLGRVLLDAAVACMEACQPCYHVWCGRGSSTRQGYQSLRWVKGSELPEEGESLISGDVEDDVPDINKFTSGFSLEEVVRRANGALELALRERNPILAGLLIGDGANPNAILDSGKPVLQLAVEIQDSRLCHVLLSHNADPHGEVSLNYSASTLLHMAAEREDDDVALALIAYRAHVNARDRDGHTPLARAKKMRELREGTASGESSMEFLLLEHKGTVAKGLRQRRFADRSGQAIAAATDLPSGDGAGKLESLGTGADPTNTKAELQGGSLQDGKAETSV